jgi:hypothetical protein
MTDQETTQFITEVFDLIEKSMTILDLQAIPDKLNIKSKNRMKTDGYPKIVFNITPNEIKALIDNKILDNELNFSPDITSKLQDPLSKLLYATAWKNGDLGKIRHIAKGILDTESVTEEQENALVFYQFGKYLTKVTGQPIIDQHVIRAFAIYSSIDSDRISALRKLEILDKSHLSLIREYKMWLTSEKLTKELRNENDYTYYIDNYFSPLGKRLNRNLGYISRVIIILGIILVLPL